MFGDMFQGAKQPLALALDKQAQLSLIGCSADNQTALFLFVYQFGVFEILIFRLRGWLKLT